MKIKKMLSCLLSVILIFSIFSINTIIATAETEYFTSDDGWRYYLNKQETIQIVGYWGVEKNITVPLEINGIKVNGLQSMHNKNVEEITIPVGISLDYDEVFYDCTSLKMVNLPDDLETIKFRTFYGCSSLKSIDIPESVTLIEVCAF